MSARKQQRPTPKKRTRRGPKSEPEKRDLVRWFFELREQAAKS